MRLFWPRLIGLIVGFLLAAAAIVLLLAMPAQAQAVCSQVAYA